MYSLRYCQGVKIAGPSSLPSLPSLPVAAYIHIVFASLALCTGPLQFWPKLRKEHKRIHRCTGVIYVFSVLAGGVAAFVLAPASAGGVASAVAFSMLATLWILFTLKAVFAVVVQRDYAMHGRWMVRSFALTFSAVTLRAYLPVAILTLAFQNNFSIAYAVISWMCFAPNVAVAELLLRRSEFASRVQQAPAQQAQRAQEEQQQQ